ncbi:MAG TPA: exodeoxyribonuclease VII large subunit [Aquabacterium sp.]|nr:exodeoxyribonuclease VII large subunit [Aquabacterium sp.]
MSNWMSTERSASRVWGVSALVQAIADSLSARFSTVIVKGEISGFTRAASGHGYFTLKDESGGASLRCAIFRRALSQVDFAPRDGMLVEARGNLSVYEARGELQLIVEGLGRAGAGALFEQFLRLKAKLEAEGLFDAARKRLIPSYPKRIAVVTSLAAAALHDALTALRRRAPHVEVVVSPCSVQGEEAPAQIVQALAEVQFLHRAGQTIDAVIVCRGGGSLEDLWAFNDERVVRAVAACSVPVISGVGHETDFTLVDFAADLRAPTPTAAAELVSRDRQALLGELAGVAQTLNFRLRRKLDAEAQTLDRLAARIKAPAQVLSAHERALLGLSHRLGEGVRHHCRWQQQNLPVLAHRLGRAVELRIQRNDLALAALQARLESVNPQRVLERGFAWLSSEGGRPVASVTDLTAGQTVRASLADGEVDMEVKDVAMRSGQAAAT